MNVLVLNAGSSSLKYQVIATDPERIQQERDERLCRGAAEGKGGEAALERILKAVSMEIHAVGHRVVHGGELFRESVVIDDRVLAGIEQCVELAPLHNPASVEGIRAARKFFGPALPQVAVFDTAFHHTLPEHAYLYAVPYEFYEKHRVRRYGFHGTSHRYVAYRYRVLRNLTREQTHIITLHLGNGCSAAAIQRGVSVDTSMGMTPLEGLVMGTRSGDLDPAVVGVIAARLGISTEAVEQLLNLQSGMLGVSGVSGDMRELLGAVDNPRACLAVEMFCYRARKYIGAYLTAMGGADAVIFTGGIGENSPEVRARICEGLAWAGLTMDVERNVEASHKERQLSTNESKLAAYCIPTDEELLIARDTVRCILGVPHLS
ncbi:MAG TPA: acetate kinase [Bryobacteraceae bacterium]|nr:acetate kinase [Bryobacteraceae bacterium]